ncbi:MAG: hypothetical protein RMK94_15785 [Armatimonadota bacterium]|nr:hypothetical protein [Armatimonadota bacterium]
MSVDEICSEFGQASICVERSALCFERCSLLPDLPICRFDELFFRLGSSLALQVVKIVIKFFVNLAGKPTGLPKFV